MAEQTPTAAQLAMTPEELDAIEADITTMHMWPGDTSRQVMEYIVSLYKREYTLIAALRTAWADRDHARAKATFLAGVADFPPEGFTWEVFDAAVAYLDQHSGASDDWVPGKMVED